MLKVGLLVRLEAKAGQEQALGAFMRGPCRWRIEQVISWRARWRAGIRFMTVRLGGQPADPQASWVTRPSRRSIDIAIWSTAGDCTLDARRNFARHLSERPPLAVLHDGQLSLPQPGVAALCAGTWIVPQIVQFHSVTRPTRS
jgi:hypothetical protein